MCGKYSLTKFANFLIIVVRAEIVTTFGSFRTFREFRFFVWICLDQKLFHNANCPLVKINIKKLADQLDSAESAQMVRALRRVAGSIPSRGLVVAFRAKALRRICLYRLGSE